MGTNFTLEASLRPQTISFLGGSVNWEYPISFLSEFRQKAVAAKSKMISGDETKFLSSVSANVTEFGTLRTAIVNFVISNTTYTATYTIDAGKNIVYAPSFSNKTVMKSVNTEISNVIPYRQSVIDIDAGNSITFRYVITFNIASEILSLTSEVKGKQANEFTGHVVALLYKEECPRLKSFTHTDVIGGANMRRGVFRTMLNGTVVQWRRPINISSYLLPKGCGSLVQKIYITGALLDNLMEYSALRYFLWFLLTGEWCLKSLRRRNTKKFFYMLSNSIYACWKGYFDMSSISGYSRYFVY